MPSYFIVSFDKTTRWFSSKIAPRSGKPVRLIESTIRFPYSLINTIKLIPALAKNAMNRNRSNSKYYAAISLDAFNSANWNLKRSRWRQFV